MHFSRFWVHDKSDSSKVMTWLLYVEEYDLYKMVWLWNLEHVDLQDKDNVSYQYMEYALRTSELNETNLHNQVVHHIVRFASFLDCVTQAWTRNHGDRAVTVCLRR